MNYLLYSPYLTYHCTDAKLLINQYDILHLTEMNVQFKASEENKQTFISCHFVFIVQY